MDNPDDNEIDLVDAPAEWQAGQAALSDDAATGASDRLPESAGMAEDRPEEDEPGRGMGSHLEELRRRLIISLAVFVPLFVVGVVLYQRLWDMIIFPLERAAPHLLRFQALGPSDGLVMAMRIAFAFALFLSLPVWLSQLWNFVAPGLTARERRWLYLSLGSGTLLFLLGASLAYFIGIPLALEFLLPFNQSLAGWENAFTGIGYVDFVITCCAGFGLAFELPLVMLALGVAGVLTPEGLRQWWRAVLLLIFVAAAMMTPPDPFTQLMLALPMLTLFGLGYMLVKWVHRGEGE
ncbi:MAG: twin-arginine translocase subunit TatC [Planctomycetaceae bacterium]|nr:twin-arginine translocase subunit TatC [Planctomycetaceae bacterium]